MIYKLRSGTDTAVNYDLHAVLCPDDLCVDYNKTGEKLTKLLEDFGQKCIWREDYLHCGAS